MYKILIFLFFPLLGNAQPVQVPSMDFLKSSIDSFHHQQAEAEILEFRESTRGRWLNYLPSPGYSVITGFSLNFNLSAPVQEARARKLERGRIAAIRRQHLLESERLDQEVAADHEALESAVNAFQAGFTIDSLQAQLFQLSMLQYKRQELTPTEILNRQQSYEVFKISRLNQLNALRRQRLDLLTKAHAWTFEKVSAENQAVGKAAAAEKTQVVENQ